MSNEKVLRELNSLSEFADNVHSKCDNYIKELPKNLEYYEDLIEDLRTLQSVANDIGTIIDILGNKLDDKNNKRLNE